MNFLKPLAIITMAFGLSSLAFAAHDGPWQEPPKPNEAHKNLDMNGKTAPWCGYNETVLHPDASFANKAAALTVAKDKCMADCGAINRSSCASEFTNWIKKCNNATGANRETFFCNKAIAMLADKKWPAYFYNKTEKTNYETYQAQNETYQAFLGAKDFCDKAPASTKTLSEDQYNVNYCGCRNKYAEGIMGANDEGTKALKIPGPNPKDDLVYGDTQSANDPSPTREWLKKTGIPNADKYVGFCSNTANNCSRDEANKALLITRDCCLKLNGNTGCGV